jgi:hypothetical protein
MKHPQAQMGNLLDPLTRLLSDHLWSGCEKNTALHNEKPGQPERTLTHARQPHLCPREAEGAATSLIAAWNPGGRGAIFASRSLTFASPGRKVESQALPLLPRV